MRHFITLKEYQPTELELIINRGLYIKQNPERFSHALQNKKLYMLFQKTSTRTSLSFEVGMNELGGMFYVQNWEDTNFKIGHIEDEVRYVARNVDIIMARLKLNKDINTMAEYSTVPVINGCCNKYHPCQAMGDLLTIKEIFGSFEVRVLYIGVRNNVFNSLLTALPQLGGTLVAITPIANEPSIDPELLASRVGSPGFEEVEADGLSPKALKDIVNGVDVVYTDTWVDMEFFTDKKFEKAKTERIETMSPFQLNSNLLQGSKAVVMHDMPMHPGYEITREVIETHKETILQQAENRRHIEKAILLALLENEHITRLFKK